MFASVSSQARPIDAALRVIRVIMGGHYDINRVKIGLFGINASLCLGLTGV